MVDDDFIPYLFVEIKSLVNSNFEEIMDQLADSIAETVELCAPDSCVYVIAMKASKIAFFEYSSLDFDNYSIPQYKGLIPLNYVASVSHYLNLNIESDPIDYVNYMSRIDSTIPTNPYELSRLGVENTNQIKHPHIWDLLNRYHKDHIHNLFQSMANNDPGSWIKGGHF